MGELKLNEELMEIVGFVVIVLYVLVVKVEDGFDGYYVGEDIVRM